MTEQHEIARLWYLPCFDEEELPVEIPLPPEIKGWKPVAYRIPKTGDWIVTYRDFSFSRGVIQPTPKQYSDLSVFSEPCWIVKKKPVTRRKIEFVECDEPCGYTAPDGRFVYPYTTINGFTYVSDHPMVETGTFKCWLKRTDSEVGEYNA